MQLTEPQAGSDVGALRTRAERAADGSYRITGQKIFITYGEHDLTDNIIHLVLARLPDAPAGHQGHFAVPRAEIPAQCRRLARRAQRRARAFDRAQARHPRLAHLHHGLSATRRRDRLPDRRGEPRHGLHVHHDEPGAARGRRCRASRIAERATQQALAYARERRQGRASRRADGLEPDHRASRRQAHAAHHARADPRRARDLLRHRGRARPRPAQRRRRSARTAAHERASLLTPVAKAFSTDIGIEVASLGVQVHGGMGYHRGDRRRAALPRRAHRRRSTKAPTASRRSTSSRASCRCRAAPRSKAYIGEIRRTVEAVKATNDPAFGWTGVRLQDAVDRLERATDWLLGGQHERPRHGAGRRHALSAAVRARGRRRAAGRGGARRDAARRERRRCRGAHRASRASSRRISRCRPAGSSAPWSRAPTASTARTQRSPDARRVNGSAAPRL